MRMIVHKGVRYRPEDAKRRGIPIDPPNKPKRAATKARAVAEEATGGDQPA